MQKAKQIYMPLKSSKKAGIHPQPALGQEPYTWFKNFDCAMRG